MKNKVLRRLAGVPFAVMYLRADRVPSRTLANVPAPVTYSTRVARPEGPRSTTFISETRPTGCCAKVLITAVISALVHSNVHRWYRAQFDSKSPSFAPRSEAALP